MYYCFGVNCKSHPQTNHSSMRPCKWACTRPFYSVSYQDKTCHSCVGVQIVEMMDNDVIFYNNWQGIFGHAVILCSLYDISRSSVYINTVNPNISVATNFRVFNEVIVSC